MKSLFILRHGKSDWNADFAADHDRPLAPRGRSAARAMGVFLSRIGQAPDLVISSTAVRADDTARLAAEAGDWSCTPETDRQLYEGNTGLILPLVQQQDDSQDSLLLAGHEPTSSEMIAKLIGGGLVRMPTAALARIDFLVESWAEVRFGNGMLVWLVTPKMLKKVLGA
ncbi:MAG: histidine phosphatase family protein [Thermoanaerobaculia bacterium]